ncbi:MAG: hypothetical protein ABSA67_15810 [Candidatus Brocadiia bacterium]
MQRKVIPWVLVPVVCLVCSVAIAEAQQPNSKVADYYRQRAAACTKEADDREAEYANASGKVKEAAAAFVKAKRTEAAVNEALAKTYDVGGADDMLLPLLKRLPETADASSRLAVALGARTNENLRQNALADVEAAAKTASPELKAAADARVESRRQAIAAWARVADLIAKPACTQAEFDAARLEAMDADNKMSLAERAYAIAVETLELEKLAKQTPSKEVAEKLAAYKKLTADLLQADKLSRDAQLKLEQVALEARQATKEFREAQRAAALPPAGP